MTGGRRPATPVRGYYYEPTVFADADAGMAISRDEIYGPVVAVIPYESEAEAVAIANDSSYGLAGSVWTDDQERGLRIARRARVGTFGVNLYVPDIGAPGADARPAGWAACTARRGCRPTWPPSACSCPPSLVDQGLGYQVEGGAVQREHVLVGLPFGRQPGLPVADRTRSAA